MKIADLIKDLLALEGKYPGAEIYFTNGDNKEWKETYFQAFNIDEENNSIEMLLDTEE